MKNQQLKEDLRIIAQIDELYSPAIREQSPADRAELMSGLIEHIDALEQRLLNRNLS